MNKTKKLFLAVATVAIITPSIALAAWWNPLSWFNHWGMGVVDFPQATVEKKMVPVAKPAATTVNTKTLGGRPIDTKNQQNTSFSAIEAMNTMMKIRECNEVQKTDFAKCVEKYPLTVNNCENINKNYNSTRSICLSYFAIHKKDVLICNSIDTNPRGYENDIFTEKDECIKNVARALKNPSICESLHEKDPGCKAIAISATYDECRKIIMSELNEQSKILEKEIGPYEGLTKETISPEQKAKLKPLADELDRIEENARTGIIVCKIRYGVR